MSELALVSIVATGSMDIELDLHVLSQNIDADSIRYSPDDSPGLYLKLYEDAPTITIFRTGSFNIRGATDEETLDKNTSLLRERLEELGIQVNLSELNITNMVYTADLQKNIDLHKTATTLGLNQVEYEPEQFPGLVYRTEMGVILAFSSGKLVLTGLSNEHQAIHALKSVKKIINNV